MVSMLRPTLTRAPYDKERKISSDIVSDLHKPIRSVFRAVLVGRGMIPKLENAVCIFYDIMCMYCARKRKKSKPINVS